MLQLVVVQLVVVLRLVLHLLLEGLVLEVMEFVLIAILELVQGAIAKGALAMIDAGHCLLILVVGMHLTGLGVLLASITAAIVGGEAFLAQMVTQGAQMILMPGGAEFMGG